MSEVLAKVYRNKTLESQHRGSIAVTDGEGQLVYSVGDPESVTFWRSAAKIFQAIPVLTSGAAEAYGFSDRALALACASHSGEPMHTELAAEMLDSAGFSEDELRCGVHAPFDEESNKSLVRKGLEPNQLHNNCSGKHAAMLAFARHIGADADTYLDPGNPVQGTISEMISLFTELSPEEIRTGVDGCSAPNFAVPLSSMARAYAKIIKTPAGFDPSIEAACRRLAQAKMRYPELVGGSIRLDTKVMKSLPGKIVCKVGAEGVWTGAVFPSEEWPDGLAFALKIEDGNDYRARPAVGIELLRQLGVMTPESEESVGEYSPQKLTNKNELEVGRVVADFEIKR